MINVCGLELLYIEDGWGAGQFSAFENPQISAKIAFLVPTCMEVLRKVNMEDNFSKFFIL